MSKITLDLIGYHLLDSLVDAIHDYYNMLFLTNIILGSSRF